MFAAFPLSRIQLEMGPAFPAGLHLPLLNMFRQRLIANSSFTLWDKCKSIQKLLVCLITLKHLSQEPGVSIWNVNIKKFFYDPVSMEKLESNFSRNTVDENMRELFFLDRRSLACPLCSTFKLRQNSCILKKISITCWKHMWKFHFKSQHNALYYLD